MSYINNPREIEERSFEIITEELGDKVFPEDIAPMVKRIIHTTADFEYADLLEILNNGYEKGMELINQLDDVDAVFITDDETIHYSDNFQN